MSEPLPLTDEEQAEAATMLGSGVSRKEVAKWFGCPLSQVPRAARTREVGMDEGALALARRMLASGATLRAIAAAVGVHSRVLDIALWRTLGEAQA